MEPRDAKILNHIGRYRLTLRPVLDRNFFSTDSSGCGNVLARLIRRGYIQPRIGLPKRRRYYQLTSRGAEGRVAVARTRILRGQTTRNSCWQSAGNDSSSAGETRLDGAHACV